MKTKYLVLLSLSGLILSLDQLVKHLVVSGRLGSESTTTILNGLLDIKLVKNTGIAFGLLSRMRTERLQEIFFIGIPVFALILIVLIFIKLRDDQTETSFALTTILGGAIGNLIDRIHYGYVIDFLDFHVGEWFHFPPFNIADCSIMIGVTVMFLSTLLEARSQPPFQEG